MARFLLRIDAWITSVIGSEFRTGTRVRILPNTSPGINIEEGVGEIKQIDVKAGLCMFSVHDFISGRNVRVTKEGLNPTLTDTTPRRGGAPVQEDIVELEREIVFLKGRLENKNQEVNHLQESVSTLTAELESTRARAVDLEARYTL